MQEIIIYVAANETLGTVRDHANAMDASPPTLALGASVRLRLRLFAASDADQAYDFESLSGVVSWQFAMDTDFDAATTHKIVADNAAITADEVVDGDETFTEVAIPVSNMNTEELTAALGAAETLSLNGELCGYDADAKLIFVLQIKGFTVRNRIISSGDPTEIAAGYLNESQVRSLIASGVILRFSSDGTAWHDNQAVGDLYFSFRSGSSAASVWSRAVKLPAGNDGRDAYIYVAYALEPDGTGFSPAPSDSLKYRAEIHTAAPITPAASDFAGAVWVKYLGDNGVTESLPWSAITGKPETFAPAAHSHGMTGITDGARQKTRTESNPASLYLDAPVLINGAVNTADTLEMVFTSVKNGDENNYTGASGDFFTWEYHVKCARDLTAINTGDMVQIDIPAVLARLNTAATVHVFVIRGIYNAAAANKLKLYVSYAYSYEA